MTHERAYIGPYVLIAVITVAIVTAIVGFEIKHPCLEWKEENKVCQGTTTHYWGRSQKRPNYPCTMRVCVRRQDW